MSSLPNFFDSEKIESFRRSLSKSNLLSYAAVTFLGYLVYQERYIHAVVAGISFLLIVLTELLKEMKYSNLLLEKQVGLHDRLHS